MVCNEGNIPWQSLGIKHFESLKGGSGAIARYRKNFPIFDGFKFGTTPKIKPSIEFCHEGIIIEVECNIAGIGGLGIFRNRGASHKFER